MLKFEMKFKKLIAWNFCQLFYFDQSGILKQNFKYCFNNRWNRVWLLLFFLCAVRWDEHKYWQSSLYQNHYLLVIFFQMSENEATTTASVASSKYPVDKAWGTILLCHIFPLHSLLEEYVCWWHLPATFKPFTLIFFLGNPKIKVICQKCFHQETTEKCIIIIIMSNILQLGRKAS